MDRTAYDTHLATLREELVCALGCTEPIAVALAGALAAGALGREPESLEVSCSGNIVKNVKSVAVPNSGGMRGIEAAALLGAVAGDAARGLEVLEGVDDAGRARVSGLLAAGACSVSLAEGVPNLYVRVRALAQGHEGTARIEGHHTNVVELARDGSPVRVAGVSGDGAAGEARGRTHGGEIDLRSAWEFAHEADVADLEGTVGRQLELNERICREGLAGAWGARIGATLLATRPNDVACRARALAAAGSDARMSGCPLPVVINCGSGNQGIACSMPVLEYARELGCDRDRLLRAVALSDLAAVHVKYFVGELSAFCGAVSAACGAGGAVCYLKGGSLEQFEATVVNTLANVGGIVCDGAKPSCAAKVAAAVDAAVLGCDMALADDAFRSGDGLVGRDAEETIRSMGHVGRVGMQPTDVEILNIMLGRTCP